MINHCDVFEHLSPLFAKATSPLLTGQDNLDGEFHERTITLSGRTC